MDDLDVRLSRLQRYLPLTESNVEAFLEEVASVTASGDRRVVRPVLLLADEQCPLGGVMEQMVSMLEVVPVCEYVDELLQALPELLARSPLFAELEVKKLLWSEGERSVLMGAARELVGERASALRAVLDEVDVAALVHAVAEVRNAIGEQH